MGPRLTQLANDGKHCWPYYPEAGLRYRAGGAAGEQSAIFEAESRPHVAVDRPVTLLHQVDRGLQVRAVDPDHRPEQVELDPGFLDVAEDRLEGGQQLLVGQQVIAVDVLFVDPEEEQGGGRRPAGAVLAGGAVKEGGSESAVATSVKKALWDLVAEGSSISSR